MREHNRSIGGSLTNIARLRSSILSCLKLDYESLPVRWNRIPEFVLHEIEAGFRRVKFINSPSLVPDIKQAFSLGNCCIVESLQLFLVQIPSRNEVVWGCHQRIIPRPQ